MEPATGSVGSGSTDGTAAAAGGGGGGAPSSGDPPPSGGAADAAGAAAAAAASAGAAAAAAVAAAMAGTAPAGARVRAPAAAAAAAYPAATPAGRAAVARRLAVASRRLTGRSARDAYAVGTVAAALLGVLPRGGGGGGGGGAPPSAATASADDAAARADLLAALLAAGAATEAAADARAIGSWRTVAAAAVAADEAACMALLDAAVGVDASVAAVAAVSGSSSGRRVVTARDGGGGSVPAAPPLWTPPPQTAPSGGGPAAAAAAGTPHVPPPAVVDRALAVIAAVGVTGGRVTATRLATAGAGCLGRVSGDAIETAVLPLVSRALLRDRTATLPSLPPLLAACTGATLTPAVVAVVVPAATDAVSSAEAAVRAAGVALAAAVACRVASGATITAAVDGLAATARGAKYSYQRAAAAAAMGALANSRAAGGVAPGVVGVLADWLASAASAKKEVAEDARVAGLAALLAWISVVGESGDCAAPPAAIAVLVDALDGKKGEAERHAAAAGLAGLSSLGALQRASAAGAAAVAPMLKPAKGAAKVAAKPPAGLPQLVTALAGVASSAKTKREDALASLTVLLRLAAVDPAVLDASSAGSALWAALLDAEKSPLLAPATGSGSDTEALAVLAAVECFLSPEVLGALLPAARRALPPPKKGSPPPLTVGDARRRACGLLARLAADSRAGVAGAGRRVLARLHASVAAPVGFSADMLTAFWDAELGARVPEGAASCSAVAAMQERLGHALFACVGLVHRPRGSSAGAPPGDSPAATSPAPASGQPLLSLPLTSIPLLALAANHVRLHEDVPTGEPGAAAMRASRWWPILRRCLPPSVARAEAESESESDDEEGGDVNGGATTAGEDPAAAAAAAAEAAQADWTAATVDLAAGEAVGLRSQSAAQARTAAATLAALVAAKPRRALDLLLPHLRALTASVGALDAPSLDRIGAALPDGSRFSAFDALRDALLDARFSLGGQAAADGGVFSAGTGLGGAKKKAAAAAAGKTARDKQSSQAAADRARAAAAAAQAAAAAATAAASATAATATALSNATAALITVAAVVRAAPHEAHERTPALLGVTLPCAAVAPLLPPTRRAVAALATAAPPPLGDLSLPLTASLLALSVPPNVAAPPSMALLWSVEPHLDPPLSAEAFALLAPLLRYALVRYPEATVAAAAHHLGSSKLTPAQERERERERKKDTTVKTAVGILHVHVTPMAVESAVAAASARAGTWLLAALEREDAAFAIAGEALADLTATALTPGAAGGGQLAQVLAGLLSGRSSVRESALLALERLPALASRSAACPRDPLLARSLWLALHDPDEDNATAAATLWESYGHPLSVAEDVPPLSALLAHAQADVRVMAARALAGALRGEAAAAVRGATLSKLFAAYVDKLPPPPPPPPPRGSRAAIEAAAAGPGVEDAGWAAREGIALALKALASRRALTPKDVPVVFTFLAARGLGDAHDGVRAVMAAAATAAITAAGASAPTVLLPMIESQLSRKAPGGASRGGGGGGAPGRAPKPSKRGAPVSLGGGGAKGAGGGAGGSGSSAEWAERAAILHADRTRENLVVCLGSVAEHLPPTDPRVAHAADQVVLAARETPSEAVQRAAARCLPPLTPSMEGKEKEVVGTLLAVMFSAEALYGERRGAAYALAGLVQGFGLGTLKRLGLVETLCTAAADEKAPPRRRQGALLAFETLALMLRSLFEPYTVRVLPILLAGMSDSAADVRDACWAAARAMMAEVSSHGVKLILPALLAGLNDRAWRTKVGAAEVLGAMAFCAPRQLATLLPQIVPRLSAALADAHPKVSAASTSALSRIAAVARNPEVRKLAPFLLAALQDPAGRTRGAVDAMLATEFVHAVDPASLALLIPPLHRGLRERATELKIRSAAIVGSMCSHVAHDSDVLPYLDLLLPDLRRVLLDAIPNVRRTAARALGSLAAGLGEEGLPGMVDWLLAALTSADGAGPVLAVEAAAGGGGRPAMTGGGGSGNVSSSAERSGAAMGLAEVSAALPEVRVEGILAAALAAASAPRVAANPASAAAAREGTLMLLAAVPRSLGARFEPRLPTALAAILRGLADDVDSVREAALDAGRNTVSAYGKTSLNKLLPELLAALRDPLWRIRQSSCQLLGDLLLVIAGAAPSVGSAADALAADAAAAAEEAEEDAAADGEDGDGEDDDDADDDDADSPEAAMVLMTTESTSKAIGEVLGHQRHLEVLAALYMARCDVSVRVRQTATGVWKTVVSNTPRALREILPTAVAMVVDALGDEDEERRAAAGRALGDLANKLGERVVPEVLPALREGLSRKDSDRARRGACEGLSELVAACPRAQLEGAAPSLLPVVLDALRDPLEDVRANAGTIFATLARPLGAAAVDRVVPVLVGELSSADAAAAEVALDGLRKVLAAAGPRLLSVVVPRLASERPLSPPAARAIAAAAEVAGDAFEVHLADVLDAVIDSLAEGSAAGADAAADSTTAAREVVRAVSKGDADLVKALLERLSTAANDSSAGVRTAAATLLGALAAVAPPAVAADTAPELLELLVRQLVDADTTAAAAAHAAVVALVAAVPVRSLSEHIPDLRQHLRSAQAALSAAGGGGRSADAGIPALATPAGVAPFVKILTEGLLLGTAELREQAALGIVELIEVAPAPPPPAPGAGVRASSPALGAHAVRLAGALIRVLSERFPWQVRAAALAALLALLAAAGRSLRAFSPQIQSTGFKALADASRLVRSRGAAALAALVGVSPRVEPLLVDLATLAGGGAAGAASPPTPPTRAAAHDALARCVAAAGVVGVALPAGWLAAAPAAVAAALTAEYDNVAKAAVAPLAALAAHACRRGGGRTDAAVGGDLAALLDAVLGPLAGGDAAAVENVALALTASLRAATAAASPPPPPPDGALMGRLAAAVDGGLGSPEEYVVIAATGTAAELLRFAAATGAPLPGAAATEAASLGGRLAATAADPTAAVEVRVAALGALGRLRLRPPGAATAAVGAAARERNTAVKAAAEAALRRGLATPADRPRLAALLSSADDRAWLARAAPRLAALVIEDDDEDDGAAGGGGA